MYSLFIELAVIEFSYCSFCIFFALKLRGKSVKVSN